MEESKIIKIRKGLDLPMTGVPVQQTPDTKPDRKEVENHALLGENYHGLKPRMAIKLGDKVKKGTPLFYNKVDEKVVYAAPTSGEVVAINRGERRKLLSVVVAADDKDTQESFKNSPPKKSKDKKIEPGKLAESLQENGLWTALRTRPFSKIPSSRFGPCDALFVNAMQADEYSADVEIFLRYHKEEFIEGVKALRGFAKKRLFVCVSPQSSLMDIDYGDDGISTYAFTGKFPASLTGTHMHFLFPITRGVTNYYINYQDTAAIGHYLLTGELMNNRLLTIAGPNAKNPRPVISRLGASLSEICYGEIERVSVVEGEENRIISGGVLTGAAADDEAIDFLGRYHLQLSLLDQGTERQFFGWLSPGANKFSIQRIYLSALNKAKSFSFTSTTNGSERAMVPMSTYERVLPHNMLATQLLRSLLVGDIEMAERLGCLELDEEDLALCSFVCPAKYEYGNALRVNLSRIEKENWDI